MLIYHLCSCHSEDCQARKLNKEDAMDHCKWRKVIKEARWSGWVWVGECFFWCRPTQVVPDQGPLNGRCCCCNDRWLMIPTVVVECIYMPYVFSDSVAKSSAECNRCSPPSSLVCGQLLTICDIIWHLPQRHKSVAARSTFLNRMHSAHRWFGSD